MPDTNIVNDGGSVAIDLLGEIEITAGAGQPVDIIANAASLWTVTAGQLVINTTTADLVLQTTTSGNVRLEPAIGSVVSITSDLKPSHLNDWIIGQRVTGISTLKSTFLQSNLNRSNDTNGGAWIELRSDQTGNVNSGLINFIAYGQGSGSSANTISFQVRNGVGTTNERLGIYSNQVLVSSHLAIGDGSNIIVGSGVGTQIGTLPSQLIGLWGKVPVVQPVRGVTVTNNVVPSGTTNQFDDFTNGTVYATDYAALHATISQLCRAYRIIEVNLRSVGLMS